MPATVIVNSLTVVHKDSGGVTNIFPDVCKTPSPGGPIPLPYPNVAMSSDTGGGASTVSADGNPIMIKSSYFSLSTGDEAGSLFGVVSNKIKGKAYPKLYSFDVKADGENVFRLSDIMLQNGGSPTNTPPGTEMQAPGAVPGGPKKDPEVPEVTKLAWGKGTCACGDEVTLDVDTKNFPGGSTVPVNVVRKPPGAAYDTKQDVHDFFPVALSGAKGSHKWITRRGRYEKDVKVIAEQRHFKGVRDSGSLEIKTVPDAKELKGPFQRLTPQYSQQVVMGVNAWLPTGVNYGWEVCYELEVKSGRFSVTRKVDFAPQGGASASTKKKKAWKQEIESIWDNKFKIHRTDCKRGDTCDCWGEQGCCSYAIRVVCDWGGGHGMQVALHAGANQQSGWGTPLWWYSHTWWEKAAGVPSTVRAHEFGHLIGMYDEYAAGACDPLRMFTNVPTSIMNAGSTVYDRHYKEFHDWFKGKASGPIGNTKLLRIK
jgi:hypothetical protein